MEHLPAGLDELDRHSHVHVICASGRRSAAMAEFPPVPALTPSTWLAAPPHGSARAIRSRREQHDERRRHPRDRNPVVG
ncbi:MAG: hypothetical protein M3Q98_00950 [Actinomycetota bacterium]|nr:hypothetical protein [Actinomycetota bacterium]